MVFATSFLSMVNASRISISLLYTFQPELSREKVWRENLVGTPASNALIGKRKIFIPHELIVLSENLAAFSASILIEIIYAIYVSRILCGLTK
jgi:hypothetical protein